MYNYGNGMNTASNPKAVLCFWPRQVWGQRTMLRGKQGWRWRLMACISPPCGWAAAAPFTVAHSLRGSEHPVSERSNRATIKTYGVASQRALSPGCPGMAGRMAVARWPGHVGRLRLWEDVWPLAASVPGCWK